MKQRKNSYKSYTKKKQRGQILAEYIVVSIMAVAGIYLVLVEGTQITDPSDGTVYDIPSAAEVIAEREKRFNKSMYLPKNYSVDP